ncbi:hypothetical protein IKN40_05920, partial [bacterium]|nr:hypothetical protein [bacterium]
MKIGSHNSFTYLPVKQWWMKLFRFVGRCQRVDYLKQLELGVTFFDLRIRFDENQMPVICHGAMKFKHSDTFISDMMKDIQKNYPGITMRVVLEINNKDSYQEFCFRQFCKDIETKYDKINFCGGNNRTDWLCENPLYKFKNPLPNLWGMYSSTTSLFTSSSYILKKIDDWIPFFYANRF